MAPRERLAARALVLSPERRVLLMRCRFPWRAEDMWITPGGSLEPGEDPAAAVVRELREETGLVVTGPGALLWLREHALTVHGEEIVQRERYYLVEVPEFEPLANALQPGDESDWFRGFRWWAVDELPDRSEHFAPRGLGALVRTLLRDGAPAPPFEIPV